MQQVAVRPMYILKKGPGKAATGGASGRKEAPGRWEQRGGQGLMWEAREGAWVLFPV